MHDFTPPDARARRLGEIARERGGRTPPAPYDVGPGGRTDGVPLPVPLDVLADRRHLLAGWSEEDRLVAEGWGVPALGGSPGRRLVNSATYAAWREPAAAMGYTPEGFLLALASGDEVVHLAATTLIQSRTITTHRAVAPQTTPLSAFTSVPAPTRIIRPWTFDGSEPAAITFADGTAGPELTVTVTEADRSTHRATVNVPVQKRVMLDSDTAADLVDRALMRSWLRVLAKELFVGGGLITPLNTYAGVPSIARATDTRALAVLKAVESIENAGYGDAAIVVVMHPTDKRVMFDEAGFNPDKFERVTFLGFDKLTQGVTFAAAVGSGTLHSSEVTVEISPDHASDFIAGLVRVQVEAFVDLHLPDAASFVKLTGM